MKIIQTYWSRPSCGENENLTENRYQGGWYAARYHCLSWALSCLKSKQFYEDVELYTDRKGKEFLVDYLELPYSRVHVCLDEINYVPKQMWAMSKIYTYGLQEEPFLHIDGDVYIWKRFEERIEQASLVSQNLEFYNSYYQTPIGYMKKNQFILPELLQKEVEAHVPCSVNAGTLGGNHTGFFREYKEQAFDILHTNLEKFQSKEAGTMNVVIEQFLFYQLAREKGYCIEPLLESVQKDFADLMEFHRIPLYKTYAHLVGYAKKSPYHCNMVERHLELEFPDYYRFFQEKSASGNIPSLLSVSIPEKEVSAYIPFQHTIESIRQFTDTVPATVTDPESVLAEWVGQIPALHQPFIKELFEFEKSRHELYRAEGKIITEFLPANHSRKTKDFLQNHTREEVLNFSYSLSSSIQINVCSYDFDPCFSQEEWQYKKEETYEEGQFIYLFTKSAPQQVRSYKLKDYDILLYYLCFENLSGTDLLTILLEDDTFRKIPVEELKDRIYTLLVTHLLYTSFIVVAEREE